MLPVAVLYTWLYNNTQGSLLLVTLFHASGNTAGVFLPIANTLSGSNLGPFLLFIALLILTAAAVVASERPAQLSRKERLQVQA
jgi:membrane protease YdiL (CAAX protease family)